VLAVAAWLESKGAEGLFGRMEALSLGYQDERQELENDDLTGLVLRGLVFFVGELNEQLARDYFRPAPAAGPVGAIGAIKAINAIKYRYPRHWDLTIETLVLLTKKSASDQEADLNLEQITSRKVGRILAKLRAARVPRPHGKGSRRWRVTLEELIKWTSVYGIPFSTLAWDQERSENTDQPTGGVPE
jgi:hypothetical protein